MGDRRGGGAGSGRSGCGGSHTGLRQAQGSDTGVVTAFEHPQVLPLSVHCRALAHGYETGIKEKEENGIPLAWCRGGGRWTIGGPTCQRLGKQQTQRGKAGAHRRIQGWGSGIIRNWLHEAVTCVGRERGTIRWLERRRGLGTSGTTDEAKLAI